MFIQQDSLSYFKKDHTFQWKAFKEQIASEGFAAHLALQKHGQELAGTEDKDTWADIINPTNNEKVYIEGPVMNGPVKISQIESIMLDEETLGHIIDLYYLYEEEQLNIVQRKQRGLFEQLVNNCYHFNIALYCNGERI